jgi:outer membrane protein OmpA-like peptidoglycan-associated protein
MKKNNRSSLVVALLGSMVISGSFFPSMAHAEYGQPTNTPDDTDHAADHMSDRNGDRSSDRNNPWNEKAFYIFGGIDLGVASYSATSTTYAVNGTTEGDLSRSGFDGGFRALLAYYAKKWVIDGGLGWEYLKNTEKFTDGNQLNVTTRTAYLDLSPRYRLTQNWQLGPEFEYWLGSDNGVNDNPGATTSNNLFLGGAQVMYEWMDNDNKFRVGGRWLTAFNGGDRSINVFQLFFQVGFTIFDSSKKADEEPVTHYNETVNAGDLDRAGAYQPPTDPLPLTPAPLPSATPWPIAEVAPTPVPIPAKKLVLTLDVTKLPFEFNSTKLPKYNADRVKQVGKFLSEHRSTWTSLVVQGHTDERGSNAYNDRLSKARANTVRHLLGEGGAPLSKIKAEGFGKRHPLDKHHNEKAWAKNRRVELEFHGVKDVTIMKNGVDLN